MPSPSIHEPLDGSVTARYSTVRYSAVQCSRLDPCRFYASHAPRSPFDPHLASLYQFKHHLGPPFGRLRFFFHFNQSPIPETRNSTPSLSSCTLPNIWWLSCCILSYRCASRHLLSCPGYPGLSSPLRLDLILSSFLSLFPP